MNYQHILESLYEQLKPSIGSGAPADYIPELAGVNQAQFGLALHTIDGEDYTVGDADTPFSIQSISKLFSLTLALKQLGNDVWRRVGREPSGTAFNSLLQLEYEQGIPRNPFINAGAIVVTDMLCSSYKHGDFALDRLLTLMRQLAGNPQIAIDNEVLQSELNNSHRNQAIAHLITTLGNLQNPVDQVLQTYFSHCAIRMSCLDLAKACHFLIDRGFCKNSQQTLVFPRQAKYINALMTTCGTYDAAGEFAYRVGLPCKSGVGGGIVAVLPGHFSVCVWSPGLDNNGNSLLGAQALEELTTETALSVF